jgi:hypothetical protein
LRSRRQTAPARRRTTIRPVPSAIDLDIPGAIDRAFDVGAIDVVHHLRDAPSARSGW